MLLGFSRLLTDRLMLYNGLNMRFSELKSAKIPDFGRCSRLAGGEDNER